MVFEGREYELDNIHFHTPSEHRIFNEHYPLEVHLVHKLKAGKTTSRNLDVTLPANSDADGKSLLVCGVAFQLTTDGRTTPLVTEIIRNLSQIKAAGSRTTTGPLDFSPLAALVNTNQFYRYDGSLTTPPCSQGVTWLVAQRTAPLNVASYNALKDNMKFNSRYTQNTPGQQNLLQFACSA